MHRTLSDCLLDIAQNAIEAHATVIRLDLERESNRLRVVVSDNGSGMSKDKLESIMNPFSSSGTKHPERKVSLGIPFLAQMVRDAGGTFDIKSEEGVGTSIEFEIDTGNVDAPPIGDLPGSYVCMCGFDGDYECVLTRKAPGAWYSVARSDLRDALGELNTVGALKPARDFVREHEEEFLRHTRSGSKER